VKSPSRGLHFRECAMRGIPWPHPALVVSSNMKWTYAIMVDISMLRILEAPGGEQSIIGGPILRIRNARQSEAVPDAASVFKREMYVCGHGEHGGYFGGPEGDIVYWRSHFANRQARQPGAASRSAHVSKHHAGARLSGDDT
jgi:hypothetical protein